MRGQNPLGQTSGSPFAEKEEEGVCSSFDVSGESHHGVVEGTTGPLSPSMLLLLLTSRSFQVEAES